MAPPEGGDEADDPVDLLLGGHLLTGACLDPADVEHVGAGRHRLVGSCEGHLVVELPGTDEERVRGAVEHGHDDGPPG